MPSLQEFQRAVKAVRPLPEVAHRVLRIVQGEDWAIGELVAIVRTEPTLVARILRLCNSARSGLDVEISSIADAISMLGSRNLVQLVLITCSSGMFCGAKNSLYADPATLWHHSVACALACQLIAARTGQVSPANAFTAGILHDVGKIVIAQATDVAQVLDAIAASGQDHDSHVGFERRMFGIDHARAAGLVADSWQLPATLANAMRSHHDEKAMAGDDAMPAVLHTADQLVLQAGIGNAFPRLNVDIHAAALERLELDSNDLAALTRGLGVELAAAAELLNIHPAGSR